MANSFRRCFALLAVGACGSAGYLVGRASEASAWERPVAAAEAAVPRDESRGMRAGRGDPMKDLERLLAGGGHPGEIPGVVRRIPLSRIPEALRAMELAGWQEELAGALYFRWAERDPEAALADAMALEGNFRNSLTVQSVLCETAVGGESRGWRGAMAAGASG